MSYANFRNQKLPAPIRYLADLARYRHLCWNLVGSDIRARFRRSYLGIAWAILQPLGYSLVIAWAWGALFGRSDYWDFAVYVFAGMVVWEFFVNTIMNSLDSLITAVGYLRQSRIPFLIFQVRVPLTCTVIFFWGVLGLIAMMVALQKIPPIGPHLLLVPAYFGVLIAFMTPIAIMASFLGAGLRDLKHIMGLALQALFFLSPVMMDRAYMESPHLALLHFINPMVPLIDMFRDPVIYGQLWQPQDVVMVSIWGAGLWSLAFVVALRSGRRVVYSL